MPKRSIDGDNTSERDASSPPKSSTLLEPFLQGQKLKRSESFSNQYTFSGATALHGEPERGHPKVKKLPLVDSRGALNIERKSFPKINLYYQDLFHTLVNVPTWRFGAVLVITYFALFVSFAVPYYYDAYNNGCIVGVHSFRHAIWFSVQTSMTIGYGGDMVPDPSCTATNVFVMLQSICSLLVAYSLLGVVYARFSQPTKRASTLVFSRYMVLHEEDGVPRLAFRVANLRKHQVIEANVRMLVALNNVLSVENESIFRFTSLAVAGGSQVFLGLPLLVGHPITSSSPLHGLSFAMMERCDMEILVLLEAVDASTSAKLQARHSYCVSDIKHNHRFTTMVTRAPSGLRSVDFAKFHEVVPLVSAWGPALTQIRPTPYSQDPLKSPHLPLPPILQSPTPLPVVEPSDAVVSSKHYQQGSLGLPGRRRSTISQSERDVEAMRLASLSLGAGMAELPQRDGAGYASYAQPIPSKRRDRYRLTDGAIKRNKGQEQAAGATARGLQAAVPGSGHGGGYDSDSSVQLLMENSSCITSAITAMEMEVAHKVTDAELRTKQWRQLVVELAARVQQSPALHAPGADSQPLLNCAAAALARALTYDDT